MNDKFADTAQTRDPVKRRVLVAPDKFKGTLTAAEVSAALVEGMRGVAPHVEYRVVPVADGGDGSLEVAFAAGYERVPVVAADVLGELREGEFVRKDRHAVIELATLCGLQQLPPDHLRPEHATTTGVGHAVKKALDLGCDHITLAVGGSASTDGGAGLLMALGARIRGTENRPVGPTPAELLNATTIDLTGLDTRLVSTVLEVAVDVDAPLLGPTGAAHVFGPQKGADADCVERLEDAMLHWANLVTTVCPSLDPMQPGFGAAGGIAVGAACAGARLVPGAETFLRIAGFDDELSGAALTITGEGRLDAQTLMGKAPAVVAGKSHFSGVPCVAVVGRLDDDLTPQQWRAVGFSDVHQLIDVHPEVAHDPAAARAAVVAIGERLALRHLYVPART